MLPGSVCWAADSMKGLDAVMEGDFVTALKEFKPLAEQGDVRAQFNLGVMYYNGDGVPQDYKTAMKWYTLSAEQGNAGGQVFLGIMYAIGQGVIQDNVYAHMWFSIAASSGSEGGIKYRDVVLERMTLSQIEKAQDLARECVAKNYKGC